MTDIDKRILSVVHNYEGRRGLVEELQILVDKISAEQNAENEEALQSADRKIGELAALIARQKKDNDLLRASHLKQARFALQDAAYMNAIFDSKNPLKKLLVRLLRYEGFGTGVSKAQHEVLAGVYAEMKRQDAKWGEARQQPNGTGERTLPLYSHKEYLDDSMTAKQLADLLTHRTNYRFRDGKGTWTDILLEEVFEALAEENPRLLKEELTQVAAVATNWLTSLTLQTKK